MMQLYNNVCLIIKQGTQWTWEILSMIVSGKPVPQTLAEICLAGIQDRGRTGGSSTLKLLSSIAVLLIGLHLRKMCSINMI